MNPLKLNCNRQLFIDGGTIDEICDLNQVLNQPSSYAGNQVDTMLTKPILCDVGQLTINAGAQGGSVAVAVLDDDGMQHEDMRMIDCAVLDTDSVRHRVIWRGRTSLEHLRGKMIRLKFYVKSAKLFSFAMG